MLVCIWLALLVRKKLAAKLAEFESISWPVELAALSGDDGGSWLIVGW